ncbi:MAG: DUF1853 family protein [Flavobacteriales bacterium]|nr:DUF1853 family protein [Flavobacteriales bacterium]
MCKNKHLRDLEWLIKSEPMLSNPGPELGHIWVNERINFALSELHANWLSELENDSLELQNFMSGSENRLLGKHYERLFEFWMRSSPHLEHIKSNIQITRNGETYSEIDFLIRNKISEEFIHFEVSCKYYLASENSSRHEVWIGPNGNDSLSEKMNKFVKQLNIHRTPEGIETMEQLHIPKMKPLGWLKGFLFVPFKMIGGHSLPKGFNRHFAAGWYLKSSEITFFESSPRQWLLLPKNQWISPWESELSEANIYDGKELVDNIQNHFQKSKKAVLIIQLDPLASTAKELSRGFVVHNKWPLQ